MKKSTRYKMRDTRYENGSALILAVVLTSLLAIVGVLFLMVARVDKIATSAISDNRELDMAIDAVTAQIAQELALDVPDPNEEYHDYPDSKNTWLASLEPYYHSQQRNYFWRQMSDIYDNIPDQFVHNQQPRIIPEYQNPPTVGDSSTSPVAFAADADGDGVQDSAWIELPDITSSKGWPIYAAVRVVDNSAMLNINTVYADLGGPDERKGDMLTDIYINGLVKSGGDQISKFISNRDSNPIDAETYYLEVSRRIENPDFNSPHIYTPYDISEELSLRNRFILYPNKTVTRLEAGNPNRCLSTTLRASYYGNAYTPYTDSDFDSWKRRFNPFDVGESGSEPNSNNYDFRHLLTTHNMERIIRPDGGKMLNVNELEYVPTNETLRIIRVALRDAGDIDVSATAAQITANLIDFRDYDEIVTPVVDDVEGGTYYGFERPCVYISELVRNSTTDADGTHRSYAIELYKPYFEDEDPVGWQLVIDNPPNPLRVVDVNWSGTRRFHIIEWRDPNALLSATFLEPNSPNPLDGARYVNPEVVLSWPEKDRADSYNLYLGSSANDVNLIVSNLNETAFKITDYDPCGLQPKTTYHWRVDDVNDADTWKGDVWTFTTAQSGSGYSQTPQYVTGGWSPGQTVFNVGSVIKLQRFVPKTSEYITVDSVQVPGCLVAGEGEGTRSLQRDITLHKCIRRLWADVSEPNGTLSYSNNYVDDLHPELIQAHPENRNFVGIGDIGKVFAIDACGIGRDDIEEDVRINLADARYQQIFNYLTVFDPTVDGINNDGDRDANLSEIIDEDDELKIPGRININTAPWYVIAQLPWMTPEIAQAIAFYRHTPEGPFRSIGQLNNVAGMNLYANDGKLEFPDLTPEDGMDGDLEERDLIFARISNLVTVRSDVFTAYILVRIGADGPQKRAVAILDRSNVYYDPDTKQMVGRVKVVALHSVPDPR